MKKLITMLSLAMLVLASCEKQPKPKPEYAHLKMSEIRCIAADESSLVFAWDDVANASHYEVVFNGGKRQIARTATYEALGLQPETSYTITVQAISGSDGFYDSDEVSFTAKTTAHGEQIGPDPDPDPDPETPEPGTGSNGYGKWFEMPVINDANHDGIDDSDNTLYYSTHICAGKEKAAGGLTARNYTVCYSIDHVCPMWVSAPRHAMFTGSSGRTDAYGVDPNIPAQYQYNSKSTGGGCNKGHMLGSAERTCSAATNRQVFYYTNIAPQLSDGFNTGGGGWNTLEDFVDDLVPADTLYETLGCYFKEFTDGYGKTAKPKKITFGGRSDVSCPTMFYYALLRTKKGNTGKSVKDCSASELQCVAFVRTHTNDLKGQRVSSKELMSIADLEKLTGFTYFPNVPNAPKSTFNASDWGL
ncbi:MAG: DNA/RNA non-specific endonuclease [Bacteroidales bacterium]|nr:DNA/RNA non-specific endonuclease [Bacteroidales bacterium]